MARYNIEKKMNNKYSSLKVVKVFPFILLCFVAFFYFSFNYLFKTYTPFVLLENNGFMIQKLSVNYLTSNEKGEHDKLEIVNVNETEYIYKVNNTYVNNDRTTVVDIDYPLFVNEGLSIVNYNDNINLIDVNLERNVGYRNLIFSYGNVYSLYDYEPIDGNNYLLISYANGTFINLYDLKVKTEVNDYFIPVNSIIYFSGDKMTFYERGNDSFTYKEILDIDYDSLLSFVFESSSRKYDYEYEKFLEKIGSVYVDIDIEIPKEPIITEEEQIEVIEKKEIVTDLDGIEGSGEWESDFVWIKPSVVSSKVSASVYSATGEIVIEDPTNVIIKSPTYSFVVDGKVYARKTVYSTGEFLIKGLSPNIEYNVVGQYTYLDKDGKTKKTVTFYSDTITTLGTDELDGVTLSLENGQIYPNKIELASLKITSDLASETLQGAAYLAVTVEDEDYFLPPIVLSKLLRGEELENVSTSEGLQSSTEYDYEVNIYDSMGNKLNVSNNKGHTRTSKKYPNVTTKVTEIEVDYIILSIFLKNTDKIEINNYRYVITNSSGKVIQQDNISGSRLRLENLDPNQIFTIKIYGDIDIDDGLGLKSDYLLATEEFTSLPITSLGFINMHIMNPPASSNEINLMSNINIGKTDLRLLNLLKEMNVKLYRDSNGEEVRSYTLSQEEIAELRRSQSINIKFSELDSNTAYKVVFTSTVQQGETRYYLNCIQNIEIVETIKKKPIINIQNSFVTKNMIDYDVFITDEDQAILSGYVRVELRDFSNKLINSRNIPVNGEVTRVTYNYLNDNTNYNIIFIADEYNETSNNSTYIAKYELLKTTKYTEDGISGKIELVSSKKVAKGVNLVDVTSEVKWEETYYYNTTIPKTVDENGHMHIYSVNRSSMYMYDLSQYHGQILTASFKIRGVEKHAEKVYFGNYLGWNVTSNSSGVVINDIPEDGWMNVSFTFRVGCFVNGGNLSNFALDTETYYGRFNYDYVGFMIFRSSGTGVSDYEIKDFMVQNIIAKEEEKDMSGYFVEKGHYNAIGAKQNGDNDDYRVRVNKGITVSSNKKYEITFNKDSKYKGYIYYASNNKSHGNYGWFQDGVIISPPKDCEMYIYFTADDGYETINPEDIDLHIREITLKDSLDSYQEYEYDFVTLARVNLIDLRNEIANNTYYIRVCDENKNEILLNAYEELADSDEIVNAIKDLVLIENKKYYIELFIKIRDREYDLDFFEINTSSETLGISNLDDWAFIQPKGSYIVLNDLDFKDFTLQKIGWGKNYLYGTIDFQGYSAILYSDQTEYFQKIGRIEKSGVLKNLVLEIHLENTATNNKMQGFISNNYGTIENVFLLFYDDRPTSTNDTWFTGLAYVNNGTIRNFIVKLCTPVTLYSKTGLLVRENNGLVENGYVYGENGVLVNIPSGATRREASLVQLTGGYKSVLQNVYSVSSIISLNESNKDYTGLLSYESLGTLRNVYTVGKAGVFKQDVGPVLGYKKGRIPIENVYYYADNLYTMEGQNKISSTNLHDSSFQKSVLGDAFNVDEMIEMGYYPQVKFTYEKMPKQEYIQLPAKSESSQLDILNTELVEKTLSSAIFDVIIENEFGDEIVDIVVSNVDTTILSQSYADGKSKVRLKIDKPILYLSKYEIRSVKASNYIGGFNETRYSVGEKYIYVDFYKEVNSVEDWLLINSNLSQNYVLMNDLDFFGYINYNIGVYTGKILGNGHKIKNIDINENSKGLFEQLNGGLSNVYFENVTINIRKSASIIGYSNQFGVFNDIHVKNVMVKIADDSTESGIKTGGLIANAYNSRISNCSVSNITVISNAKVSNAMIGGMIGLSEGSSYNNIYVQNVNLAIKYANNYNGVGGIIGRETWEMGLIENAYSTGVIDIDGQNVGGIAGYTKGNVVNSYSTVSIINTVGTVGGIVGFSEIIGSIQNNLFLGNIAIKQLDFENVHQIVGAKSSGQLPDNNYGSEISLVNGKAFDSDGEGIVTLSELYNEDSYNIPDGLRLGEFFDYSSVASGILPKLYYTDSERLLPNQVDNSFDSELFKITNIVVDKMIEYANIRFYIENKNNLIIDGIDLDGMNTTIVKQVSDDGMTIIDIYGTPTKYYDAYLIKKIRYHHENDETIYSESKFSFIEMIFYKELKNYDDWQSVSTLYAENYLLVADLDFTGLDFNTGLLFNRLETEGNDIHHTISGMNYTINVNKSNIGIISRVDVALKNVNFDDITLVNNNTSNGNYFNLINILRGKMENASFTNIEITALNKNYVAIVGNSTSHYIDNINLDNIEVNAKGYVASFIAYYENTDDNFISNVDANHINVTGTGDNVGGVFAFFTSANESLNISHIDIKNSNVTSENGKYVGGIAGAGGSRYSEVNNVKVKGKEFIGGAFGSSKTKSSEYIEVIDSEVEGSVRGIGGIAGGSRKLNNCHVYNTKITGTSVNTINVAGILGDSSEHSISYCTVNDSTIINNGDYTGGIVGRNSVTFISSTSVNNVSISGNNYTGGLVGEMISGQFTAERVTNSVVHSVNDYAGGFFGYVDCTENISRKYRIDQLTALATTVSSNRYAGGIMGTPKRDLTGLEEYMYKIYFDGDVYTEDGETAEAGSGKDYNSGILNHPRVGIYEESTINGEEIKDMVSNSVSNINLIERTYAGYINNSTGKVETNNRYPEARYTDFIELEARKTYHLYAQNSNIAESDTYKIHLYNANKVYLELVSSGSNTWKYFGEDFALSNTKELTFTAMKNCYIRVSYYYSISETSLVEIEKGYGNLSENQVLSSKRLRNPILWNRYLSDNSEDTGIITDFGFDRSLWDFNTLNNEIINVQIPDKSGNDYVAHATATASSEKGLFFGAANDGMKIDNYSVGSDITVTMVVTPYSNAAGDDKMMFVTYDYARSKGILLHLYKGEIRVKFDGTRIDTGCKVPLYTESTVTMTYSDNNVLKIYINGILVYTKTNVGKTLTPTSAFETYVGTDNRVGIANRKFMGFIRKAIVFHRALGESEIRANYSSTLGVTNTEDLAFSYDFSECDYIGVAYYPLLKTTINQAYVPIPNTIPIGQGTQSISSSPKVMTPIAKEALDGNYHVYSSGINTINLEFDTISADLNFSYQFGDYSLERQNVSRKVYTLYYDYESDVEMTIKNAYESKKIFISKEDIQKTIQVYNGKYYHIENDNLYENRDILLENALNIYDELVLLRDHKIYSLNTGKTTSFIEPENVLMSVKALYNDILSDSIISTYYNYTEIVNIDGTVALRKGQLVYKNNYLYINNSENNDNSTLIVNNYNGSEYQFVLGLNGELYSYKTNPKFDNQFINSNIKEISADFNNDLPIIMIRYNNGQILAYNYYSGDLVFSEGDRQNVSLSDFLKITINNNNIASSNSSYSDSNSLKASLENISDEKILEILEGLKSSNNNDNSSSSSEVEVDENVTVRHNNISQNYIISYNESTNSYDVYDVNDVINGDISEPISLKEKIKNNKFLYDYFYSENRVNDSLQNNRVLVYISIITLIIINLGYMAIKLKKRSKE